MKNFIALNTDFYQISMIFANVTLGRGNNRTGFEGFVRNIKTIVNPHTNFYIFDGEIEIKEYINIFRKEIIDPEFPEVIIEMMRPKITAANKEELIETFRQNWKKLNFDFEYSVIPNGTKVFPLIPVFQYDGPNVWGQLIETYGTNTYNGRTALKTINYLIDKGYDYNITTEEFNYISGIINDDVNAIKRYANEVTERAKAFRNCTSKILLEAGFRRAPNFNTACMISKIALDNGFNGTSNTNLLFNGVDAKKVGGTMAHAFIMGFETEEEAFIGWDKILPATTMITCTYNVENAVNTIIRLIKENKITAPNDVRIDNDPIEILATNTSIQFEKANIGVGNYLSGDMSVKKITEFEKNNIPFTKTMVGTKLVYGDDDSIVQMLNCGFVYKVVEFELEKDGEFVKYFPEKKGLGKANFSGLKEVIYDDKTNMLNVYTRTNTFGFTNVNNIDMNPTINFI